MFVGEPDAELDLCDREELGRGVPDLWGVETEPRRGKTLATGDLRVELVARGRCAPHSNSP